ncbi:hypothetical protein M2451_000414 [Dysgonomonas sp. PFB1-18]|uniref:DUF4923 family protein n=1 Tax=unclassified Dysgonomonas TaxID=2630389 RepID=UPI00247347AB|nr:MULTISPECIES: DUF4923 family protein [unclassified Dysgonomonas]MDL2303331.1 DUF4923 family protein [Dysgonomonas sp. OttesenSCG-928-D17]MDH6307265.1 hypothetical protein [Dysgonomonas sp. PF1-14]MDH6337183.1 hypothetical protein [Dysgonomonas sp. PF1-16]MDH6379107.1 hypothetical protein [Dysgonomonas sp. PFB1-18]MDH6396256.1 hypothetical protein [Dysgonomonas sp. PF1-23]
MKKNIFILTLFLFALVSNGHAQSLKDLLNKETISSVVSAVTGSSSSTDTDISGTWSYTGSAVELKSDNILKKAGGKLATSSIESKLNSQLSKVGIKEGATTFTFNSDSTFTVALSSKTQSGTYSIDKSTEKINLVFSESATIAANYSQSDSEMTLTFDADKFMSVISYVSSSTGNSTLGTLNSLLQGYDGIQIGLTLKKQ